MVGTAYRNSELVANLATQRTRLGKAQMVSVRGRAAAHHARLGGYESAMVLVAQSNGFGSNPDATGAGIF